MVGWTEGRDGWQAIGSPDRLTTPRVRDGERLVEASWDTAMNRIVDRSREPRLNPVVGGGSASTPAVSCSSRSTTALAVLGKAGIGIWTWTAIPASAPRRRQPRSRPRSVPTGSLARIPTSTAVNAVIVLWGHNVAKTQSVGCGMLDRRAGPAPPAVVCVDPRQRTGGDRGRRAPRPAPGHQRGRCQRHHPPPARGGRVDAGGSPPTRSASSSSSGRSPPTTRLGWPTSAGIERTASRLPAEAIWNRRASRLHRPARGVPVEPGHRRCVPGATTSTYCEA